MSDLNKRLQLGPQVVKKDELAPAAQEEEEKEKTPLVDARKGRARGPARRAPAKSPTPATASAPSLSSSLSFSKPSMLWHVHPEDGTLNVPEEKLASVPTSKVVKPSDLDPVADSTSQSLGEPAEAVPTQISHISVNDEAEDGVSGSTENIKPDETQTGKTAMHTNSGVDNEHPTAGTQESLVAYVGEAAPEDGDVAVKGEAA
jgi:hypothetical protein